MDPNKGLLEIFLDGNYDEPAYIYKGEMGIKTKNPTQVPLSPLGFGFC